MQTVTDQGIVNYPLPYYMTGVMREGPLTIIVSILRKRRQSL